MPYLNINNLPLYYQHQGATDPYKPLVIFFNGWCLSARYWEPIVAQLANQFDILLFDSRGFGRSQPTYRPALQQLTFSIDESAAEAGQLLAQLNLAQRPLHVVGHSMGTVIASRFATQVEQQGNLLSLTLINGGTFEAGVPQSNHLNQMVGIFARLKVVFDLPLIRGAVISRSVAQPINPSYARYVTRDFKTAHPYAAAKVALSSLQPAELARYHQELTQVSAPLLLIVGDLDATIPPQGMYNIKKLRPAATLVAFPECGHLPMLEQSETFAAALGQHWQAVFSGVANESQ